MLDGAGLDLDVDALDQQVLQREHLAGAEQRYAVADIQPRRRVLADATTVPPRPQWRAKTRPTLPSPPAPPRSAARRRHRSRPR